MNWEAMSKDERDAAYNNVLAVPDSARLKSLREAASAAFRAAHPAGLDIPYGPEPRQKWDLFPATATSSPCLVFIHGGYWQMNSREAFACLAEGLTGYGWSVALPSYRLAPEATLGQIVDDIRLALDWLASDGPAAGIGGPVVLSGWSAGGHLAAMTLDHPIVTAGLAISGIFELGRVRDTYLNAKLNLSDEDVAALSPMRLPVVGKRFDIAYGMDELPALVAESRDFHVYRALHNAPGELIPIPMADHFTVLDALQNPSGLLARHVLDLVGELA
jgi:pimeloyl-ACP methyl ester carboxylesterase